MEYIPQFVFLISTPILVMSVEYIQQLVVLASAAIMVMCLFYIVTVLRFHLVDVVLFKKKRNILPLIIHYFRISDAPLISVYSQFHIKE